MIGDGRLERSRLFVDDRDREDTDLVEADDDGLYVVKFRGAGQGPLANALREAKGAEQVLAVSVEIEEEISQLEPSEQGEFLKELGLEETAGLNLPGPAWV